MVDLDAAEGFDWDAGNERKSTDKHGVTRQEAEQVFGNGPLALAEDGAHSDDEPRFHALGRTDDGRLLHVTFTMRDHGTRIRIISARDASKRERTRYRDDA